MDYETDQGIQEVLRKELNEHGRDRTLVTIAHRLKTIIDYDSVVVMSGGSVLEYVFYYLSSTNTREQREELRANELSTGSEAPKRCMKRRASSTT